MQKKKKTSVFPVLLDASRGWRFKDCPWTLHPFKQGESLVLLEDKNSFILSEFRALKGYCLPVYSACVSPRSLSMYLRAADPVHGYLSFLVSCSFVRGAKSSTSLVRVDFSSSHGLDTFSSRCKLRCKLHMLSTSCMAEIIHKQLLSQLSPACPARCL